MLAILYSSNLTRNLNINNLYLSFWCNCETVGRRLWFCFQRMSQVGELFLFSVIAYSVNLFHNKPVFSRRLTAFCCLNYLITNLKLYSSIFLTIQALSILLKLWKALWLQVLWESREWTDFLCCFSLVFSLVWRKYLTCMNAKGVNDYLVNLCRRLKLRYK